MRLARPVTILLADEDSEDRMLTSDALDENGLSHGLRWVVDGEELIDYLRRRRRYAEPGSAPRPDLILLDLNMPRKTGCEALAEIKSDPALRTIPVVVFTTSKAEEDVRRSYELGANSYVTKPATFDALVDVTGALVRYWLDIVEPPPR
jgi:CheY-like chemotaxis protein